MNISENSIIRKSEDLLEADMNDSLALMSIDEGSYYGLNPVGKEIWNTISEPISVRELINKLQESFSVDVNTCQKETLIFLEKLQQRKMVTIL